MKKCFETDPHGTSPKNSSQRKKSVAYAHGVLRI